MNNDQNSKRAGDNPALLFCVYKTRKAPYGAFLVGFGCLMVQVFQRQQIAVWIEN